MKRQGVARLARVAALLLVPFSAIAQVAPVPAAPDTVWLKDGTSVTGTIVQQEPGKYVTIRTASGAEQTFAWDSVSRVEKAPAAVTTATVGQSGASFDSQQDCAPNNPDERCKSRLHGDLASGAGVGFRQERVVRLKAPTDHYVMIAIDGGFMYGKSTGGQFSSAGISTNVYGGGANFNLQYRVGGTFPDAGGGSWNGFGLDVSAGVFGAGVVSSANGNTTGAGMLLLNGGATVGYQYFTFGQMNDDDFKQHGFGLFLGGRAGVADTKIWASGVSASNTNLQYGPEIQLTFPDYNFGTARREAFYISAYVLPTGDFFFANIQLGGAFSI